MSLKEFWSAAYIHRDNELGSLPRTRVANVRSVSMPLSNYDWSSHIGRYNDINPEGEQIEAENPIELRVEANSSPEALNVEQRKLYDIIVAQYNHKISLSRLSQEPLLLNVDGVL